jgi:hypothetical protein
VLLGEITRSTVQIVKLTLRHRHRHGEPQRERSPQLILARVQISLHELLHSALEQVMRPHQTAPLREGIELLREVVLVDKEADVFLDMPRPLELQSPRGEIFQKEIPLPNELLVTEILRRHHRQLLSSLLQRFQFRKDCEPVPLVKRNLEEKPPPGPTQMMESLRNETLESVSLLPPQP